MITGSLPRLLALFAAVAAATGAMVAWAASGESTAKTRAGAPTVHVPAGKQCVEPAEVMRREHMNMLKHQRDRTVREGIRGERVSLAACVECHAGPGTGPAAGKVIGSPDAFCETCHRYAAVKLDCFECHRASVAAAGPGGGGR